MSKKSKKNETRETLVAFAIFLVIVAAVISAILILRADDSSSAGRKPMSTDYMDQAPPVPYEVEGFEAIAGCPLGALNSNLSLSCLGIYGEEKRLAVIVENIGTELVSFAEVKINTGYLDAFFEVEHLPVGGSMLIFESSDITYDEGMEFRTPLALSVSTTDAYVKTEYSSDFNITVENGILALENCSGRDFFAPVEICCKKIRPDGLYFDRTIPLATEGRFANGETRYFNFEDGWQIVCLAYTD